MNWTCVSFFFVVGRLFLFFEEVWLKYICQGDKTVPLVVLVKNIIGSQIIDFDCKIWIFLLSFAFSVV